MLPAGRWREDRGTGRRRSFALTALALIGFAAWSVPASEAGRTPLYKGTFKAELHGSYRVDWKTDRYWESEASNGGPQDCEGSGFELVTFATPAPLQVKLSMNRPTSPPLVVFTATGDNTMHLAATLERSANMIYNGGCPELNSCSASAQPEWLLELRSFKDYEGGGPTDLTLGAHKPKDVADPLPQCTVVPEDYVEGMAYSFPELWNKNTEGRTISDSLFGFKLFKRKVKKFKFSASGFDDDFVDGHEGYRQALEFTLLLKRTSR